jgi:basic amino acid/polyamine antiporter, APA family
MIITLFLSSSFSKILNYIMFFDSIALVAASASLFVLRHRAKKNGEPEGIYKIKGYPWLPAIFIIVYSLVNLSILISNPLDSAIGFVLFVSGFPLYWVLKKLVAGKSKSQVSQ